MYKKNLKIKQRKTNQVEAKDAYGDGWTGALPGRTNTWAITESLSPDELASSVANGTLPAHHYSGATTLCLQDGLYAFQATADTTWSSEATWSLCGVTGGAGGSMEFEVRGCLGIELLVGWFRLLLLPLLLVVVVMVVPLLLL